MKSFVWACFLPKIIPSHLHVCIYAFGCFQLVSRNIILFTHENEVHGKSMNIYFLSYHRNSSTVRIKCCLPESNRSRRRQKEATHNTERRGRMKSIITFYIETLAYIPNMYCLSLSIWIKSVQSHQMLIWEKCLLYSDEFCLFKTKVFVKILIVCCNIRFYKNMKINFILN